MVKQLKRQYGRSLRDFCFKDELLPSLPAEKKLLEAARRGWKYSITKKLPNTQNHRNIVRSAFLRFLLLGGDSEAPVHENGIQLYGAFIDGDINLDCAENVHKFALSFCYINGSLIGCNTRLKCFDLEGSYIHGIDCSNSEVSGNIFLHNGFSSDNEVRFHSSNINGQLNCEGGVFKGTDAINCDCAIITGDVFVSNNFKAYGAVRFVGAEINGDFVCSGGIFETNILRKKTSQDEPDTVSDALSLANAQINGTLWLGPGIAPNDKDVIFNGSIDLQGTQAVSIVDQKGSWPTPGHPTKAPCVIRLDGFTYERFMGVAPTDAATRKEWLQRQPEDHLKKKFRPQPFEQLAKVLHKMGHEDAARNISMFKLELVWWRRSIERKVNMNWSIWTIGKLWKFFAGYGYRPQNLIWFLFFIWVGSAIFYCCASKYNAFIPVDAQIWTNPEIARKCENNWTTCQNVANIVSFNAIFYSADVLLPVIDLKQRSTWMPLPGWTQWIVWFEHIFGSFCVLLLGAILGGLVKRE